MQKRLSTPSKIRQLLADYDLRPSKRFGQNFIADFNIVKKAIKAANVTKSDVILEIGPGLGGLTEALLETGAKVCGVELDRKLYPMLKETFKGQDRLKLVQGDALKIDLSDTTVFKPTKMVSNLPYNIAAPLLAIYLHKYPNIKEYVVMLQKEVADRVLAKPSTAEYGSFTVKIALMAKSAFIGSVSRNSFVPKPNVDSSLIYLKKKKPILRPDEREVFFRLVDAAFSKRRKIIINSLSAGLNIDRDVVARVFQECAVDFKKRAQDLEINDFLKIFYRVKNY